MIDNKFDYCFKRLMELEGGYSNDKYDKGGETKYGISKKQYPELDIATLNLDDAKCIYKMDYYLKYRYNEIDDHMIACKIFTMSVVMGYTAASRIAQRALRAVGIEIKEDGIVGSKTISMINENTSNALMVALKSEEAGHYRLLAERIPTNEKFLKGWLNRAYS